MPVLLVLVLLLLFLLILLLLLVIASHGPVGAVLRRVDAAVNRARRG